MKKFSVVILFSLFSISLFASGHGADVVGSALLTFVLAAFCVMGFAVLTVLNIVNNAKPGPTGSRVYAILLSIFTIDFLYVIYDSVNGPLTDSGRAIVIGFGVFFILVITLNIFLIVRAFQKLKKNKSWQKN